MTPIQQTLEEREMAHCPHPLPPPLPPLHSIQARVTMDRNAHLPSTWRTAIGKVLTNRRIAEYQREGRYGSGLVLPPIASSKPCIQCGSKVNTRFMPFDYLPKAGVYCKPCKLIHRAERDKQKEADKKLKELFVSEYQ